MKVRAKENEENSTFSALTDTLRNTAETKDDDLRHCRPQGQKRCVHGSHRICWIAGRCSTRSTWHPTKTERWKSGRLAGIVEQWRAQCLEKGEAAGMFLRDEAGGRRLEEQCTADPAQEHGLPEADHRASRRAGRSRAVVCVPSLSSVSV